MESEYRESGVIWLRNNTNIDVEEDPLPANVELFLSKYGEIMSLRPGIASESISGLSQSFSGESIDAMLRRYASAILGEDCLTYSDVRAFPAEDRWVY